MCGMSMLLPGHVVSSALAWRAVSCGHNGVCEVPFMRWDATVFAGSEESVASRARHGGFVVGVELNRWCLCVHKAWADGCGRAIAPGSIPAFPRLRRYYATLLRRPAFVEAVFDNELRHQGLLGSSAAGAAGRRKNGGGLKGIKASRAQ